MTYEWGGDLEEEEGRGLCGFVAISSRPVSRFHTQEFPAKNEIYYTGRELSRVRKHMWKPEPRTPKFEPLLANLTLEVFGPALRLSPPEPLRPNLTDHYGPFLKSQPASHI